MAYYGELRYVPDLIKSLVQYACHELTIGRFMTAPCALSCLQHWARYQRAPSSLLSYLGMNFGWLY